MSIFKKATKEQARARIAFIGPAGSGKTMTSLKVAKVLAKGGTIAVLDTERGSASKYADIAGFDVAELTHQSPDDYVSAIGEAAKAGYAVLVIDSLSHAWAGVGGALEMVDKAVKRSNSRNSFAAWRDVTPRHNRLVDTILNFPGHVICTMRSKTEYILEDTGRGTKAPRKVGLAPIQRDGVDYEFDIVGEIDQAHTMVITKSRCPAVSDLVIEKPGDEFAQKVLEWLTDGVAPTEHVGVAPVAATPVEAPTPAPQPASTPAPTQPAATSAPKPTPVAAPAAPTAVPIDKIVARIAAASSAEELGGIVQAAKGLSLTDADRSVLNKAYMNKTKEMK